LINPPFDGLPTGSSFPAAQPAKKIYASVTLPEDEQKEIVTKCETFKKAAIRHASGKKEIMRRCYAYSKNKHYDGDLLPLPSTDGNDRDANKDRPQIFLPVTRQNLKTIHSQLKLTIFPNDEDYMRVRSKTAEGMALEDSLTEALKYKFKESLITEKLGDALWDAAWSGMMVVFPTTCRDTVWEWKIQPSFNPEEPGFQYVPNQVDLPAYPDIECWNPLNFYMDPNAKNAERAKWVYISRIKKQEIIDSDLYINKDKLDSLSSNDSESQGQQERKKLDIYNDLSSVFEDVEPSIDYDLYYFPYVKTSKREYRNMIFGVAAGQVLVRCHPNIFPKGLNPVVYCGWMSDPRNPYSQGPAEDMMSLQKLCNLLENFKIELMSRNTNRYVASPNANFDNLHGVVGGVIVTENPAQDVIALQTGTSEIEMITNEIGVWKAEAQTVAGSQNPFQGSSNIDFKKTATEMQLLQEQFISIIREVIEHLTVMGIQRVLERLMYLMADMYETPVTVPVDNPMGGREYMNVDLSVLKSGDFTIELVSVNPSQSKQAQVQSLMQLSQLVTSNPQALILLEPIISKIGDLQGVKDISNLIQEIKQRLGMMQNGPVSPQATGMGINPQPPMGEPPPAPPPGAGEPTPV
jgi:hypothetical protein